MARGSTEDHLRVREAAAHSSADPPTDSEVEMLCYGHNKGKQCLNTHLIKGNCYLLVIIFLYSK